MEVRPHSNEWYDRLATRQKGYASTTEHVRVDSWSGEKAYLELVRAHLDHKMDVLDAGCGHGDVPIELAPLCRQMIGYDRVENFIELARANAHERGVKNVTFIWADSTARANDGHARLPAEDHSLDMIISRRGPIHWFADAKRVLRPGGILIQLCMLGRGTVPAWNDALPKPFKRDLQDLGHLPDSMLEPVQKALEDAGIEMHSYWTFDVPALVDHPKKYYEILSFGKDADEVPAYEEVTDSFVDIFSRYGRAGGLELREGRLLWKAVIR
ncbi:MAG: methyltransferase domain-containing protein [Candidatus Latescibacteria bacterium]|nr:methyltransferase domain-containing protein [Candidatus Latescibacterota bacterium]